MLDPDDRWIDIGPFNSFGSNPNEANVVLH